MKTIKNISNTLLMLLVMISFSKCSTTKKLKNAVPFIIGEVYYQHLIEDVKSGDSRFNLFIPVTSNPNSIILDSVYFKGQQAKLEASKKPLFIGRFKAATNQKKDIIMSSDPYAEYGNEVPELPEKVPFKLEENECVISYKQGNTLKYFKISNILLKKPKY